MFPGWDLPGVMTTGAAQVLWRSYRVLPGARVVVAGNGPLNFQVARELMLGGAQVPLVAEAAPPPWKRPGAVARMMASDPRLAAAGAAMLGWLVAHRAMPRFGTRIERVEPAGSRLRVHAVSGAGRTRVVDVDAVCMNHGFHPQKRGTATAGGRDALRRRADAAGAGAVRTDGDPRVRCIRGWRLLWPRRRPGGACGRPHCRPRGRGEAGRRILLDGGQRGPSGNWSGTAASRRRSGMCLRQRTSASKTSTRTRWCADARKSSPRTFAPLPIGRARASVPSNGETRAGMGRCQGRYCSHILAPHLARRHGRPMGEREMFAPRPPIRPVAIESVLAAAGVDSASDQGGK